MSNKDWGTIEIQGNPYTIVAKRIQDFRDKHDDYSIVTKIMSNGAEHVLVKATIKDTNNRTIATGHAEEARNASYINKTSAIENAETSAIGRALAALGYGGTSFASAEEITAAIEQQEILKAEMRGIEYMRKCNEHIEVINEVKDRLSDNDLYAAAESLMSLSNQEQMAINRAPTKGGIFTLQERKQMTGEQWEEAKQVAIKNNQDVDRSM